MGISGALVLYAVIWALTFYCVLPQGIRSQSQSRKVVRGTPASAPSEPRLSRKTLRTTLIATPIWAAVALGIELELVPLEVLEAGLRSLRE